jgi:ketosteroid isomerase-like protein
MRSVPRLTLVIGIGATLLAAWFPVVFGVTERSPDDVHLGTLVELEEHFARAARERGTRAAFLEYLAEDGILFRPGPVAGRAWWLAEPEDPGLLQWYPSKAAIAESADLGYTLGPWSYGKRRARPRSFGHYVTVWRREADGSWRAAIDGGIAHPKKSKAPKLTAGVAMYEPNGARTRRLDVDGIEQRFANAAREAGYESAAASWANSRSIRMRDGAEPGEFLNAEPAAAATAVVEGSGMSASADLAYAYGTVTEDGGGRGAFLHIWRLLDGEPVLAVDLFTRYEGEG